MYFIQFTINFTSKKELLLLLSVSNLIFNLDDNSEKKIKFAPIKKNYCRLVGLKLDGTSYESSSESSKADKSFSARALFRSWSASKASTLEISCRLSTSWKKNQNICEVENFQKCPVFWLTPEGVRTMRRKSAKDLNV